MWRYGIRAFTFFRETKHKSITSMLFAYWNKIAQQLSVLAKAFSLVSSLNIDYATFLLTRIPVIALLEDVQSFPEKALT